MTIETESRPLDALQPSQLLVSAAKLRDVLDWWNADDPAPEPLPYLRPVEDLGMTPGSVDDSRVVLADGHTRALAAALTGVESLPVSRDPDPERLDSAVYRTCLEWCEAERVREPADLVGRVVADETFRIEWVERCQAITGES